MCVCVYKYKTEIVSQKEKKTYDSQRGKVGEG